MIGTRWKFEVTRLHVEMSRESGASKSMSLTDIPTCSTCYGENFARAYGQARPQSQAL